MYWAQPSIILSTSEGAAARYFSLRRGSSVAMHWGVVEGLLDELGILGGKVPGFARENLPRG
jgi:hypothetical protein